MSRVAQRLGALRVRTRAASTADRRPYSACYAPSIQLYFQPDGDVRACCRNMSYPLGNVADAGLLAIWNGPRRQELVDRLGADDFSHGCEGCQWEIATEGRAGSYPASFESKAGHLSADPETWAWPRWMEFNLSNHCNLQCIQCNGDLSSSIRIHRERRPPLPRVYGDAFFDDLATFLPHLDSCQFAGGEPFLGQENFRAWDLIADVAPDLACQVVTNVTQWSSRIEAVLEKLRIFPIISMDGVSKATYENVRVGADLTTVLTNVDRLCEYAQRAGTDVAINFCLMAQNYREFGPLLRYAEERDISVNVSVVHYPEHCSILRLPAAEVATIHQSLLDDAASVIGALHLNADVWHTEVDRIGAWLASQGSDADQDRLWGMGDQGPFAFAPWADRQHDTAVVRRELEAFAEHGTVHAIRVDLDERIVDCPDDVARVLGVTATELEGSPVTRIQDLLERRHGTVSSQRVIGETADRIDVVSAFDDLEVRTTIVAIRDDDGRIDHCTLLFGSRPPTHTPAR